MKSKNNCAAFRFFVGNSDSIFVEFSEEETETFSDDANSAKDLDILLANSLNISSRIAVNESSETIVVVISLREADAEGTEGR